MNMSTRLRGLNIGGWLSQIDAIREKDPVSFVSIENHVETFITEKDFQRIRQWGFNHVRIPIDAYVFFSDDQKPIDHRFIALDNAVAWSRAHSLGCIIDLHECPGHDFAEATEQPVQKIFVDDRYIQITNRIWAYLAERYGAASHVYFEVLNEPVAPTAEVWNGCKNALSKNIRTHAPRTPIIVGSNMWNWPSTFGDLTPLEMDRVVYNFHFYEPLLFTHQQAPWISNPEIACTRGYPGDYGKGFVRKYGMVMSEGIWNRDRIMREIEPVAAFGKKHGADIICDEFGVYAPVALPDQKRWLEDLLGVLKEFGIGFSYWNYKNLDFGIISRGECLHERLPQYNNPERTAGEILSILQCY
jgi:endoglucanase